MSELPFNTPPEKEPPAVPLRKAPEAMPRGPATTRVARRPVLVMPSTSKRDTIIALACGAGVLALMIFGVTTMYKDGGKVSKNQLTGIIKAKHDSGEKETEISVGRKGLKSQQTDSGFSFDVWVESEKRQYEVPVNEGLYNARKVGDQQSFMRPPSEHQ